MSRRSSDKTQARLYNLILALAVATSVLAPVVSFKAIRAVDGLNELLEDARRVKSMIPEGY